MNEFLVITWTDSVPAEDGRAEAARDGGGRLLAAGPVHDAGEPPSWPWYRAPRTVSCALCWTSRRW